MIDQPPKLLMQFAHFCFNTLKMTTIDEKAMKVKDIFKINQYK